MATDSGITPAGISAVMKFFGMKPAQFRSEWASLSETDKAQLRNGVGDFDNATHTATGTLTY